MIGTTDISYSSLKPKKHQLNHWRGQNLNRINFASKSGPDLAFEFGYEIEQVYENVFPPTTLLNRNLSRPQFRVIDFRPLLTKNYSNSKRSYYLFHQIDRLMMTWEKGDYEFIFGRQQISFGNSKLNNPTDLYSPFSLETINKEEKSGVDALRMRKILGEMGELDFGIILGPHFEREESGVYLNILFSQENFEIRPSLIYLFKAMGVGLDLLLTVKGGNLWFESLYLNPKNEEGYLTSSFGYEYSFSSRFFLTAEYLFNGSGTNHESEYLLSAQKFSVQKTKNKFVGKHYLNFSVSYELHPLVRIGMTSFQNLGDGSLFLSPHLYWDAAKDWVFEAGAFIGAGKRGGPIGLNASEFGLLGKSFFLKLKRFF